MARRIPDLRQAEAAECGLACLGMIASFHGQSCDLATLRQRFPVSLKGMTLATVIDVAAGIGLDSRALRLEPEILKALRLPAVLHWDMSHFVVLTRVKRDGALVIRDPARGEVVVPAEAVGKHFTGVALELWPTADFGIGPPAPKLRLRDLMGSVTQLAMPLAQAIGLSIVLQIWVLASPFYLQLAVDEAVIKDDRDLLLVLAAGFGGLMLLNAAAGFLRARVLIHVQASLSFAMGTSLFRHLLRLPLGFFERRHVGDLITRFGSIEPLRNLLAEGLVTAVVDGAMTLLTGWMVFLYSVKLGWIVLLALAAYALLRAGVYRAFRLRSLDLVQARARESSNFIETLRGMQSVKLFGAETMRLGQWANRYADILSANAGVERLKAGFRLMNDLVFGMETLAVVYFGANAALDGQITIGMLFAFISYKQQFIDRSARLIERAIELRMLDLHLERLSDIAMAEPEPDEAAGGRAFKGVIELRDVSFRYAESEPFVFEGINLRIDAGEYVAIAGPSGGGKTTLLKVMLGLLPATSGEVLIDGVKLAKYGARRLREQVGVVMQDDALLSGSIGENIRMFADTADFDLMRGCADLAGVAEEIERMPMNYNTLIGDMGSSLSGGQRQRVLLARALYRKPRALFMDEGTSHLDTALEARVNERIRALGLTRVIIAHRPETIASADRVVSLVGGTLRETEPVLDAAE